MSNPTLPIDSHLVEITAALQKTTSIVLKAEPGAGKTTRLPPHLLQDITEKIIVLEPRRLAARHAAERVAAELGEPCGRQVGYLVRHDSCQSRNTRLLFVTEGVFIRLIRDNPTLSNIGCVVLDEFHERNIQTDLALALVRRLQTSERTDLKLVIMSATLDTSRLENYLENTRVFDIKGRVYPLDTEYLPLPPKSPRDLFTVEAITRMAKDDRCPGHILVFLTGIGEIVQVADRLRGAGLPTGNQIIPLAATLPYRQQALAFAKSEQRKIILTTNVAETSLTVPGVTGVIDPGFAKIAGHASWSGMPTLDIKRISKASCIQRAGRAGRMQKGLVYRLYAENEFLGRDPYTQPDIKRLDLTQTLLDVLSLGLNDVYANEDFKTSLPWFEKPDDKTLTSAITVLQRLRAIDERGNLNSLGHSMSIIPMHPRLAAVILAGHDEACAEDALAAACLISENYILRRSIPALENNPCDICFQLDCLKAVLGNKPLQSEGLSQAIDHGSIKQVERLYGLLAKQLDLPARPVLKSTKHAAISRCLLAGFPDRVARKRTIQPKKKKPRKQQRALYNFCLGRGGLIAETSVIEEPDFIIAVDATESLQSKDAARGTMVRVASTVDIATLESDPANLVHEEIERNFNQSQDRTESRRVTYYGQIVLKSTNLGSDEEVSSEELTKVVRENWPQPFGEGEDLVAYHTRTELIKNQGYELDFPVFEGELLDLFITTICEGRTTLAELAGKKLKTYIREQLPYEQQQALESMTPDQIRLANGRELKIHYHPGNQPWAQGYIQDFFGLRQSPALFAGRLPITLHLQAPNRRPAQVTGDLTGFWRTTYFELKKELSRRYPRHNWPDDPTGAMPFLLKSKKK